MKLKNKLRILVLVIILLIMGILMITASEFTPQGNINLYEVYGISNATNVSASYFIGDGSNLTGISVVASNYSILSYVANITDFPTLISNFTNDNTYWNDTFATFNKTYADTIYYAINNPSGFYNSTDFSISNYFTKTEVIDFGFYNSTDFSISDYYTQTEVNAINTSMNNYVVYTNGTMKSYVDSQDLLFNTSNNNYITYTNETIAAFVSSEDTRFNGTMKDYVDLLLNLKVSWTDLWGQVYNETEVNAINTSMKNYVDSNPGSFITELSEDTTPQLGGYLDADGNNIGATDDEIENVYVGDTTRIYFGDGQDASIYYNGTNLLIVG